MSDMDSIENLATDKSNVSPNELKTLKDYFGDCAPKEVIKTPIIVLIAIIIYVFVSFINISKIVEDNSISGTVFKSALFGLLFLLSYKGIEWIIKHKEKNNLH
jgi:hypothetical protein